ncbi:hypothetical protein M404DRAFT_638802 [Pisolithus tinctorius Marx 270]|uniref:Uncharacterized protein n=1 Tax=Pisolithus tinctorius Marx 270 TaxID=870435 RepID=A0A0C3P5T0_PISTI|nr:hypothetical protein M404DRAFT_638802 [Pisolithus tinctorius Marx 270]
MHLLTMYSSSSVHCRAASTKKNSTATPGDKVDQLSLSLRYKESQETLSKITPSWGMCLPSPYREAHQRSVAS